MRYIEERIEGFDGKWLLGNWRRREKRETLGLFLGNLRMVVPLIKIVGSVRTILVGKNNYFGFKTHDQCVGHHWK